MPLASVGGRAYHSAANGQLCFQAFVLAVLALQFSSCTLTFECDMMSETCHTVSSRMSDI